MFSYTLLDHVGVTFSSTVPVLNSNDGATAEVVLQVNLEFQGCIGHLTGTTVYQLQRGKKPTPHKLLKKVQITTE